MILLPVALVCVPFGSSTRLDGKRGVCAVWYCRNEYFCGDAGHSHRHELRKFRTAIAMSIGTLLFLFLGVATCMRIMLAFNNSFENQLTTFMGCIAGEASADGGL